MKNTHEQEKKQFARLFQKEGMDRFDERFKVLEAFLKLDHHVTGKEIQAQLKSDGVELSLGFIAASMEHLCRFGFAVKVDFEQGEDVLYEHRHLGAHHDHMICTRCGAVLEFKDELLEQQQQTVAEAYGFHMLQHKMEIYGICADCMAHRRENVSLNNARPGERLLVKSLEAGKQMQLRISSLGLKVGDEIEVVSSGFGGQVVIAVGDNRLVIGNGMAQKIWVQPLAKGGKEGSHTPETGTECHGATMEMSRMKAGQEGVIARVSGSTALRRRLLEMGINRGTRVRVEKYAPLKDPLELVVKGYHISLRVEEAANILVENVTTVKK